MTYALEYLILTISRVRTRGQRNSGWWGVAPAMNRLLLDNVLVAKIGMPLSPAGQFTVYLWVHQTIPCFHYLRSSNTFETRNYNHIQQEIASTQTCLLDLVFTHANDWNVHIVAIAPNSEMIKLCEANGIISYKTIYPYGLNMKIEFS
jgi:hypothetical protein